MPKITGYFRDTEMMYGALSTTQPWPDAKPQEPLPPLRAPVTDRPRLDVTSIFRAHHDD